MTAVELVTLRGHTIAKTIIGDHMGFTPARRAKYHPASTNEACISAVRRSLAVGRVVEVHPTYNGWAVYDAGGYHQTNTHGYYLADGSTVYSVDVPKPWDK